MSGRSAGWIVGWILALAACGLGAPAHPDIDADLSELRLFPVQASAPEPQVSAEEAVSQVVSERSGPIEILRVGRRSNPESTYWVVIFRPSPAEARECGCVWAASGVDDQTGAIIFGFDDLSWRAFDLPPPPWE